ncbi:1770_t:CDS:1, partial [Gigaspora margarita]
MVIPTNSDNKITLGKNTMIPTQTILEEILVILYKKNYVMTCTQKKEQQFQSTLLQQQYQKKSNIPTHALCTNSSDEISSGRRIATPNEELIYKKKT